MTNNQQKPSTRRSYPWAAIVKAARAKGTWLLHPALTTVPTRTVESITLRRHPALDLTDGRLEARATNTFRTAGGAQRCDVWVRFIEKE